MSNFLEQSDSLTSVHVTLQFTVKHVVGTAHTYVICSAASVSKEQMHEDLDNLLHLSALNAHEGKFVINDRTYYVAEANPDDAVVATICNPNQPVVDVESPTKDVKHAKIADCISRYTTDDTADEKPDDHVEPDKLAVAPRAHRKPRHKAN